MASFRPKPHPPLSPNRRQKKHNNNFLSRQTTNSKEAINSSQSEKQNNLLPDVDAVSETYYPKTTSERLTFHRNIKRKLGRIQNDIQLDHFNNSQSITTESTSQKSREKYLVDSRIRDSSLIYESTITQRELDSMSIAESILMSEINRNVLEIVLECLLPSTQTTQADSTQNTPAISSGSAEAVKEEMNRQNSECRPKQLFNFSCVPSTIHSLQQELHSSIKKELSEITSPEPKRPSKLTDNISQKVKAMEERRKASRMIQIENSPQQIQPPPRQPLHIQKSSVVDQTGDTTVNITPLDVSKAKEEEPKRRRKVAVIEEMSPPAENDTMSWQKEVVLPITCGVSLGMMLDILEQNVVIVGFREVRPGVMGAAEASKCIDVGDMLLAINGHSLQRMEFEEIVDLVRSLTATKRHRQVVLLLGISEYIHAELNKGRTLSSEEQTEEDPFLFLDGVNSPKQSQHFSSSSFALEAVPLGQYCSFPGDLGLNVDSVELERRFQIMFQEGRKLRKIRANGIGYGFYDNAEGISPLFSSLSIKIVSNDEIKFKHKFEDSLESSIKEELNVQIACNGDYKHASEVFSGGVDDLGTPWGLPPDIIDRKNKDSLERKEWKPTPHGNINNNGYITEKKTKMVKESEMFYLKDKNTNIEPDINSTHEPVGKLVQEVVELDETLSELELQLQHYTSLRGRQVVIPDELNALFIGSIDVNEGREEDMSTEVHGSMSESEVGQVLHMILNAMSSIDLSERWCNPLDAWPPRRLTLTLASYIGFHIRDSVNSNSFRKIESTLSLFLILARSHWLAVPPISPTNPYETPITPHPSLRCVSSLKEPKDILHRNLICDLTTLYFQIRSVGWQKLVFIDPNNKQSSNSKGYFWDLEVAYNTNFIDLENDVKKGVLWSEDRAVEFVNKHGDFLRVNECISCAGGRQWILVTSHLLDLATSHEASEGSHCRDASQLVGRILNRYSKVEEQVPKQQECLVEVIDREQHSRASSLVDEKEGKQSLEPLCENQWQGFFKPKNDEIYEMLPTSHLDTLQLLETLFKHCEKMDGYSALLLEVGQLIWKFDSKFASRIFSESFPYITPWHVWYILKNTTQGPLSFNEHDIGLKVLIWKSKVNKYLTGSIIGFNVEIQEKHKVKFEQGLIEEFDMTKECFEVFGFEMQSKECEIEVDDFQTSREHDCWWYPKILYHSYLTELLGVAFPYQSKIERIKESNKVACSNDSIVEEFIELSLLLASDVNHKHHLSDRNNERSEEFTESLRTIRHGAYREGLDQSDGCMSGDTLSNTSASPTTSDDDLLRYAQSLGMTAKEERIRNSIIYAKKIPFFGPFQHDDDMFEGGLDFDAWLLRIVKHSDYAYPKDSELAHSLVSNGTGSALPEESLDWMSYLKHRWLEHGGDSRATYRCTDVTQCHIDFGKLERLLNKFSLLSDENNTTANELNMQNNKVTTVSYRSAWPCKSNIVREPNFGNTLQKAWNNVLCSTPAVPDTLLSPTECLLALDRIMTKSNKHLELQLATALLYHRYGYWDGVLNICESILHDADNVLFNESMHVGIWLYELIRLALFGTCQVEKFDSLYRDMTSSHILKAFFLVFKLSERYSTSISGGGGISDNIFASRMPFVPPREISKNGKTVELKQSDHLLLGLVIDAINLHHALQLDSDLTLNERIINSSSFYDAIINSLIEVLGVVRTVAVVENLHIFINDISFGDRLLRCAFEFEVRGKELKKAAHRNLSIYHASIYTNTNTSNSKQSEEVDVLDNGWGCVLGEFDVCPLCSLPLTDAVKGIRPLQVSAFRCGHMFHSACLGCEECFICQVQSQSSDSLI